jgi:hypothetical protein
LQHTNVEKLLAYVVIVAEQKLKANIFHVSLLPLFNCVFRHVLKIGVVGTEGLRKQSLDFVVPSSEVFGQLGKFGAC